MRLRTRGHDFELPIIKYGFNKRNCIVQSLFNYVWFCVLLYYLHFVFYCTHVRMSYVLNSYLLTYLLNVTAQEKWWFPCHHTVAGQVDCDDNIGRLAAQCERLHQCWWCDINHWPCGTERPPTLPSQPHVRSNTSSKRRSASNCIGLHRLGSARRRRCVETTNLSSPRVNKARDHSLANCDSCPTPAKSEAIEYLQVGPTEIRYSIAWTIFVYL